MDDIYFLRHLFDEIREKYHLPPLDEWSNKHFSELSENIYHQTGVLLSRNTLKNILKKIYLNDVSYSPQSSTRNALAKFLGCDDWRNYRDKYHHLVNKEEIDFVATQSIQKKQFRNKPGKIILVTSVIIVLSGIGLWLSRAFEKPLKDNTQFSISLTDTFGLAPHTISIDYDFSMLKQRDSVHLDFNTYSAAGDYELKYLPNRKGVENFCYHHPGLYQVRLFINRREVKQWGIFITSNGWRANVFDAQIDNSKIPNWIQPYRDSYFRFINFDNIISDTFIRNGVMRVTEQQAYSTPKIPKNYKTEFANFRDYGVSGDNFHLAVLFYNEHFGEETFCYSAEFTVVGTTDKISFRIMQPGCKLYARYKFSDHSRTGIKNIIEGFEHDFSYPRLIEIINTHKNISLEIDGVDFFTGSYQKNIGQIIGLQFDFKGAASVDSVALSNQFGQVVYSDGFQSAE